MSDLIPEQVPIDSDYEYEFDATRKATTTGILQAAAGLTGVTAYFTLTKGGAALGATTITLAERSGTAGRYSGICGAAAMTAALTAYIGQHGFKAYVVAGDRTTHQPVVFAITSPPL